MIQPVAHPGSITLLRSDLLADCGVPHAFTTRQGGVSAPPFDSLNLGNPSDVSEQDGDANIAENYRRLQHALGCDDHHRAWVHQVHGGDCYRVSAEAANSHPKADAMLSDDPGVLLTVRVADCMPVLIAAGDGRAVAAVHAGWRGVVTGVIGHAVAQLAAQFDADPGEMAAAVGPSIGPEHFEVGEEVADAFDGEHVIRRAGRKPHVDLAGAAAAQLVAAGLPAAHVDRGDWCTYRDADLFFSHRREHGRTGRMAAVIAPAQLDIRDGQ